MSPNRRILCRLAIASTIALLVVSAPSARAEVEEVTLRVDGLSCPFCAYSLEKKLAAVPGVTQLTINVAEGTATAVPQTDMTIEWRDLRSAVKAGGFTPREFRVRGKGLVSARDDTFRLTALDGTPLFEMDASTLARQAARSATPISFAGTLTAESIEGDALPRLVPTLLEATSGDEEN